MSKIGGHDEGPTTRAIVNLQAISGADRRDGGSRRWLAWCGPVTAIKPMALHCPRSNSTAFFIAAALLTGLNACTSTAPGGRQQLALPQAVGAVYSSIDLDLKLAAADASPPCIELHCKIDRGFEQQVARLGARLADVAYAEFPETRTRIPAFRFVVADKVDGGTGSNAIGTIVVFRGIRRSGIDEESLAFLIAREMAHVIARHHEERSAAGIISTVLAKVLLGPISLAQNTSIFASSAASAVGKEVIRLSFESEQDNEADAIALRLVAGQGWASADIAESLVAYAAKCEDEQWSRKVRHTIERLRSLDQQAKLPPAPALVGAG